MTSRKEKKAFNYAIDICIKELVDLQGVSIENIRDKITEIIGKIDLLKYEV